MSVFVLQRAVSGHGSKPHWFDAESFGSREEAAQALKWAKTQAQARIAGMGGTGFTMKRPQQMRVVEVTA